MRGVLDLEVAHHVDQHFQFSASGIEFFLNFRGLGSLRHPGDALLLRRDLLPIGIERFSPQQKLDTQV